MPVTADEPLVVFCTAMLGPAKCYLTNGHTGVHVAMRPGMPGRTIVWPHEKPECGDS